MKKIAIFALLCMFCASCQTDPNKPILFKSPEQYIDWVITPRGYIVTDEQYLQYKHQDEVAKTLSIAEVKEAGSLCVIFYSYSIGATVYRKIEFCKKVDEYLLMARGYRFTSSLVDKSELAMEYGITRDEVTEVMRAAYDWQPNDDLW